MKVERRKKQATYNEHITHVQALKSEGEFLKAIGLTDFLLKESDLDDGQRFELICLRSECQLRLALFAEALSSALHALHESRAVGSQEWIGRALFRVSAVYAGLQMFDLAISHCEEAATIHRKCSDKRFYISTLVGLSAIRLNIQDFGQARRDATTAARMAREIGAPDDLIKAKVYISESCVHTSDLRKGLKHAQEALQLAESYKDGFLLAKTAYTVAKCYFQLKNFLEAERAFAVAAERFFLLHDTGSRRSALEWLARVHEARGEFKDATVLYKTVLALERELLVEHRQSIRIHLAENNQSPTSRLLQRSPELTPTEIKVCELLLKFFSNKEMAKLLGISVLTVERHRFNIRRKLGLRAGSNLPVALLNI
jgi:tetratricopeptide (TPR) repeat protein